jgi:hypothetical protein
LSAFSTPSQAHPGPRPACRCWIYWARIDLSTVVCFQCLTTPYRLKSFTVVGFFFPLPNWPRLSRLDIQGPDGFVMTVAGFYYPIPSASWATPVKVRDRARMESPTVACFQHLTAPYRLRSSTVAWVGASPMFGGGPQGGPARHPPTRPHVNKSKNTVYIYGWHGIEVS